MRVASPRVHKHRSFSRLHQTERKRDTLHARTHFFLWHKHERRVRYNKEADARQHDYRVRGSVVRG